MELSDLDIESDGYHLLSTNNQPHGAMREPPPFSGPVDVPASAHQHVREQSQATGKVHEQPFASRLNSLHNAPANALVHVNAGEFWQNRFKERDCMTSERAIEGACCAKNRVSLGH
jgi:hypothetical protein